MDGGNPLIPTINTNHGVLDQIVFAVLDDQGCKLATLIGLLKQDLVHQRTPVCVPLFNIYRTAASEFDRVDPIDKREFLATVGCLLLRLKRVHRRTVRHAVKIERDRTNRREAQFCSRAAVVRDAHGAAHRGGSAGRAPQVSSQHNHWEGYP